MEGTAHITIHLLKGGCKAGVGWDEPWELAVNIAATHKTRQILSFYLHLRSKAMSIQFAPTHTHTGV